ncbi:MAG: aminopeptidase [Ruminococcaceae bacterium]|nr:aminopeptidase [Oscillospiraceae bacterium]
MTKKTLKNYAKLIAKSGVNVQKGQEVVITAETDQPEFVALVAEECYKLGAKRVVVDWCYQPLTKLNVKYRTQRDLSRVEEYEEARLKYRLETLPAMIHLHSADPDGLKGINQDKYSKATQAIRNVTKKYRDQMDNKYQWCIAAVPSVAWAKKVFPNERKSKAVEMLWEAILYASRCDDDPIAAWDSHNKNLHEKCKYLNDLKIKTLIYKASNGTDLRVGMNEDGEFLGGAHETLQGIEYNANIPSEEVFVSPKKGIAEGIVYSSKPLSYQGEVIDNFSIRFENGKAVEVKAEKNEELLKKLISMDEGSSYLGECALVPYDSPIRNSGVLFYTTLFDENAACHFALGRGFTNTIKDYDKYTLEELHEKGINDSMIHVDFMIGTEDLDITAETFDGKKVQIFKNGNWAF